MQKLAAIRADEFLLDGARESYPAPVDEFVGTNDGARLDESSPESLLIGRLQAGDRRAFDLIFTRYANRVYRQALKLMGNEADAEEVVQEVFLLVYQKAQNFRGNAAFFTWVYRVTLNAAVSRLRRQKNNDTVDIEEYLPRFAEDGHHLVRPVVDWSDDMDQRLMAEETQKLVRAAIDQLAPVDKAILMSDLDGFSNREISETLGLSVQAVKARLHRARLFLRGKLAVHFGHSAA